jgi:probable HAF family extracellular repeat protein
MNSRNSRRSLIILSSLVLSQIFQSAGIAKQPSFQGLGDLPGGAYKSYAYGVSSDGSVVVGYGNSSSGQEAFRWTSGGGMVSLVNAYSTAYGVSSNGSVVVGDAYLPTRQAFSWTPVGGVAGLGYLTGAIKSSASGISADGSVVVGYSSTSPTVNEATLWTSGGGMVGLGDLQSGQPQSYATATSANGSVVVGQGTSASGPEAFRWTSSGGMVGLGDLTGGSFSSYANAVCADGSVVVGYGNSSSGQEAFRWTSQGGMVGLGDLAGGAFGSNALAVSADGSIVVGSGSTTSNANSYARYGEAFYWTESGGMQNLKDMLINSGADLTAWDGTTWTLTAATGISADGKTIVGYGFNGGSPEAWIATIPEPATLFLLTIGSLALRKRKA